MLRSRALWFICASAVIWCIDAAVFAQAPASPTFEVASVKPNDAGGGVLVYPSSGGLLRWTNMALFLIIGSAYDVPGDQVVGPDWIRTSRFDVVAKTPNNLPAVLDGPNSIRPMLRALLEERFKLAVHHETRPLSRYTLVLARSNGRLGLQLHQAAVDCEAVKATTRARGGPPPAPPQPGDRPTCGGRMSPGHMFAGSVPVSQLATMLSVQVRRTVIDHTGLTGTFDLDLSWTPDQLPQGPPPPGAPPLPPIDPNGPSIFTALQEQLGLKLEPTTVPSDVVVVDHVEQLIPN